METGLLIPSGKRGISNDPGQCKSFFSCLTLIRAHFFVGACSASLSAVLFICVTLTCPARLRSSTQCCPPNISSITIDHDEGLHDDSVHCHVLRHSTAMRIWEKTQRPGAITGYLCHSDTASVYPYLRENDAKFAEDAMAAVLTI
jgi:hypothetical protein